MKKINHSESGKNIIILSVQISFEGLTKDGPQKKPSKLICTPNIIPKNY